MWKGVIQVWMASNRGSHTGLLGKSFTPYPHLLSAYRTQKPDPEAVLHLSQPVTGRPVAHRDSMLENHGLWWMGRSVTLPSQTTSFKIKIKRNPYFLDGYLEKKKSKYDPPFMSTAVGDQMTLGGSQRWARFCQGEQPAGRWDRAGRGSSEGSVGSAEVCYRPLALAFSDVCLCTCIFTGLAVSGVPGKRHDPFTVIMSGLRMCIILFSF